MANCKKAGRNDPCPCGSGKKYKDCCLRAEEEKERWELFRRKMDGLYPKINAVNVPLLIKKNIDDNYDRAEFIEAMDFTVTSNALSLIRSVHQKSEFSAATALSARDVVEALVLIKMSEDGVFTEEDERLFLWQYALVEYDTYYKDGEKFAALLNLNDLTARYERAKKIYNDAGIQGGVEGGKLRQVTRSRAPFICKHLEKGKRADFNKLLEKYLPAMLPHYEELSYYVHPNVNTRNKSRGKYLQAVKAVIEAVAERYANYGGARAQEFGGASLSVRLEAICNPADPQHSAANKIQCLMLEQGNILVALAKGCEELHRAVFQELTENLLIRSEDNYLTRFFGNLPIMLYDLTYDYLLDLKECVKIKFKTVAETFAHYDKVVCSSINSRAPLYGVSMLKFYELVKAAERAGKKLPEEIPPETAKLIYEDYKENYPAELYPENPFYKIKDEEGARLKFLQSFCQPLGNFTNGKGETVSYLDLSDGFFAKTYGDEAARNNAPKPDGADAAQADKPVLARDFLGMLYRESNNMSHGCGYLYFANYGAMNDAGSVMQEADWYACKSVRTLIDEIVRWQKLNGREEHYAINEFLKNLNAAAESLAFIALEKSVLYQTGGF